MKTKLFITSVFFFLTAPVISQDFRTQKTNIRESSRDMHALFPRPKSESGELLKVTQLASGSQ